MRPLCFAFGKTKTVEAIIARCFLEGRPLVGPDSGNKLEGLNFGMSFDRRSRERRKFVAGYAVGGGVEGGYRG